MQKARIAQGSNRVAWMETQLLHLCTHQKCSACKQNNCACEQVTVRL